MRKSFLFFAATSLALFGAGCFSLGPRITKDTEVKPQVQVAQEQKKEEPKKLPTDNRFVSATGTGLAYLDFEEAQVEVVRNKMRYPGHDGLELASGDLVAVSSGAAYVVYPGRGASRLEAGSEMMLLAGTGKSWLIHAKLQAGKIWTRFEKVFGPEESYSVEANGVVSTVRGTAFGVAIEGDGVDVQVADHAVSVSPVPTLDPVQDVKKFVSVAAGQGLKIALRQFSAEPVVLESLVRRLNVGETMTAGYRFGAKKLNDSFLLVPENPLRLTVPPVVTPEDQQQLQYLEFLRLIDSRIQPGAGFMPPDRTYLETEVASSTVTPSVNGPVGGRSG